MESKIVHLLHCPFTGLGLYQGFRGNRWLRNRIKIFKQFVIPSILNQTNKDFTLWLAWRYEEKNNTQVKELKRYLDTLGVPNVFTYAGICFWDDKYPDEQARDRLINSIHYSVGELMETIGEAETILMTIQPSDDCYHSTMVQETRDYFNAHPDMDLFGYRKGYVMDYVNQRLAEWNPQTTPPFYTIKYTRENFTDPLKHLKFTGPYKSHEYPKDYMKADYIETRGFLVGCHSENISTIFSHPYTGHESLGSNLTSILSDFGIESADKLKLPFSFRKWFIRQLPYGWRRKLRYIFGEKFAAPIYSWIRS